MSYIRRGQPCPENPLSKRSIGLEIEVANCDSTKAIGRFAKATESAIVEDGSLTHSLGCYRSYEVNLPPATGDKFVDLVNRVSQALENDSASVNSACGYHVHVGASDANWWDIRRLVKLYAEVEDALFGIVAPSRRDANYSRECGGKYLNLLNRPGRLKEVKKRMLMRMYGKAGGSVVKRLQDQKHNVNRYDALNIHSWFFRGTIEFRHHHGTVTRDKLLHWALLCAGLVEFAISKSDKEVSQLPSGLEGLLRLCPTANTMEWVTKRWHYFEKRSNQTISKRANHEESEA